ncbi:MAG: hypothetical protein CMN93_07710 [Synechococcus sp. CPC35]|nr:hypothetical protein [Synechococcus sp. CPC35]
MVARLETQFPGTQEAMGAIRAVVAQYRQELQRGVKGLELEVRFGRKGVVDGALVDRVITWVQGNPDFANSEWVPFEDSFFHVAGVQHRCRTQYDTDRMNMNVSVVRKERVTRCALASSDGLQIAVVLSREVDVPRGKLAHVVHPHHVRMQQRKRIGLPSRGFGPAPTWALDASMVWSAACKSEAERAQMCAPPQYGLELELLDPEYVVHHDDAYVACSIGLKVADLLPAGGQHLDLASADGR